GFPDPAPPGGRHLRAPPCRGPGPVAERHAPPARPPVRKGLGMVQGVRVQEVTDWLVSHVSGLAAPLRFELISRGRSNPTHAVTDATGRRIVLRRPPVSHVLSTAHDMAREYRVISALRDTDVPVAPALAFCSDESVNDRPFYLMEFVDGHVLRDVAGTK